MNKQARIRALEARIAALETKLSFGNDEKVKGWKKLFDKFTKGWTEYSKGMDKMREALKGIDRLPVSGEARDMAKERLRRWDAVEHKNRHLGDDFYVIGYQLDRDNLEG